VGLTVVSILAVLGAVGTFAVSYADGHYLAGAAQLAVAGAIVLALVLAAFRLPRTRRPQAGPTPPPWQVLAVTLIAGAIFEVATHLPAVSGVVALAIPIAVVTAALLTWSRRAGWTPMHTFAAAAGGLLTYAWHSFFTTPVADGPHLLVPISHLGFAMLAVLLLILEYRRLGAAPTPAAPTPAVPATEDQIPLSTAGGPSRDN
jgi:hypothetical protein